MNDEEIFERLKKFVIKQRWEYDFPLTKDTTVEEELKITGDDAVDFLIAYGKNFNVDVSHFMAADYFDGEGDVILPAIIRIMTGKKKPFKKTLTLGHLEKGIMAGKLDEEVINS
jgi:acyl carrier protein